MISRRLSARPIEPLLRGYRSVYDSWQEQTAAAERAIVAFKQQNNIVSADGKRIDEQNLADLNTRLVAARNQSSDALARLTRIESIIRTWNSKRDPEMPVFRTS